MALTTHPRTRWRTLHLGSQILATIQGNSRHYPPQLSANGTNYDLQFPIDKDAEWA
jgi:hypothetical protein